MAIWLMLTINIDAIYRHISTVFLSCRFMACQYCSYRTRFIYTANIGINLIRFDRMGQDHSHCPSSLQVPTKSRFTQEWFSWANEMEICGVYWIVEGKVKIFSEISGGRHLLRYHPTASLNIHEPWWQLGSTGRGSFVCFDSSVLSAASSYGCRHLTIAVSRNSLGRKRKRGIFRFFFSLRYWWNVTEFATGRRIYHLNASTQRMTNARNSQSSSSKISEPDRNNYSFFFIFYFY